MQSDISYKKSEYNPAQVITPLSMRYKDFYQKLTKEYEIKLKPYEQKLDEEDILSESEIKQMNDLERELLFACGGYERAREIGLIDKVDDIRQLNDVRTTARRNRELIED